MRAAFTKTITELAARDDRVVLLTGDLGFMALEPFADRFPNRFYNVGVAEQNMVGIATGLAEAGFIPYVYSIVTFATLRPYEFIRNGPILQQLPVRIVGIGGGVEYGHAGPTHHGLEDIAVMRAQPGITVIAPADSAQTTTAMRATWDLPGPIYYRLGKNDTITVPGLNGEFTLGGAQVIRRGADLLMVTTGGISNEVAAAAESLSAQGVNCTVAVVATLNPPPVDDLTYLIADFPEVISVEAHYVTGGLGSLVAEIIAENGLNCRLTRCGVRGTALGVTGSQNFLQHMYGLSASALVETTLQLLQRDGRG